MKYNISKIILFYLLAQSVLFGQQEGDIEEIVIEGKTISLPMLKTSQNVQVITREQISKAPGTSIEEVLAYYTSMDIRQRGVHGIQADISIRGSSFEQVLVLVNGIRMQDNQTGHNTMNIPFDLASVERIEISKGPASRRFGQNAFAGVINIITKPSGTNDISVSATGGEFGTYSIGIGVNLSGKRISQFFQAETSQSDGYRYNTDYQSKNAWYQAQYKVSEGDIHIQAGIIDKKFGANGFYSSPEAKEQYEHIQTSLVSAGWNQKFNQFRINSNLYWRRAQDEYLFLRSDPSFYRNLHIGNNAGIEVNSSYVSKFGITGVGVDLRGEYLSSTNLGDRNRWVTFVFIDHHFSLFRDALDITPGISFSEYTHFGNFWYPGIDIGYTINPGNKLFANIGKTYRVPSYTDLYYSDPVNDGNPDLKPENALSYEVGYRLTSRNIKTSLSLFRRESKDLIDWIRQAEGEKWKPENIAQVTTQGIEVDFNHRILSSFIKSYSVGYTYLDTDLKRNNVAFSRYSLDNLRHQLIVKLDHKIVGNFSNQIIYRYNDRVSLDDYHLLDDKLMYQGKDVNFFIQVNNILNTKYTESNLVPMPGRWVQLGATFRNVF